MHVCRAEYALNVMNRQALDPTEIVMTKLQLRLILEQQLEWQSSLDINFVDFEKAFGSVKKDRMCQLLRHENTGIPSKIFDITKTLDEELSAQVMY